MNAVAPLVSTGLDRGLESRHMRGNSYRTEPPRRSHGYRLEQACPAKRGKRTGAPSSRGDLRVRMVGVPPGYLADHWCDRGHILYVVEGELDTELRDGRAFKLLPGMSYQVSDHGDAAHRSSTKSGAKIFIVD